MSPCPPGLVAVSRAHGRHLQPGSLRGRWPGGSRDLSAVVSLYGARKCSAPSSTSAVIGMRCEGRQGSLVRCQLADASRGDRPAAAVAVELELHCMSLTPRLGAYGALSCGSSEHPISARGPCCPCLRLPAAEPSAAQRASLDNAHGRAHAARVCGSKGTVAFTGHPWRCY